MGWAEEFGTWLRDRRHQQGQDTRTLSKNAGVGIATISRAESGYKEISLQTLIRLCQALNANLDEIALILYGRSMRTIFGLSETELAKGKGIEFPVVDFYLKWIRHNILAVQDYEYGEIDFALSILEHYTDMNLSKGGIALSATYIKPSKQEHFLELIHTYKLPAVFLNGGVVVYRDIGYFIKRAHRENGKTHVGFKQATGLSGSVLSNAEKGYTLPLKLDALLQLEKYLGIEGRIVGFSWRAEELYSRFDKDLLAKDRAGEKVPYPNEIELIEGLVFRCRVWFWLMKDDNWRLFNWPLP